MENAGIRGMCENLREGCEISRYRQGEFTIRERFNHISVPASRWSKMTKE